jgi:hypothetical protein
VSLPTIFRVWKCILHAALCLLGFQKRAKLPTQFYHHPRPGVSLTTRIEPVYRGDDGVSYVTIHQDTVHLGNVQSVCLQLPVELLPQIAVYCKLYNIP